MSHLLIAVLSGAASAGLLIAAMLLPGMVIRARARSRRVIATDREPLGDLPPYRLRLLEEHYLATEAMEGPGFESALDELLKGCAFCGCLDHEEVGCGCGPDPQPDDVQMVWASAAVAPFQSSAAVLGSVGGVYGYVRRFEASGERLFAGLEPVYEVGRAEPVDHLRVRYGRNRARPTVDLGPFPGEPDEDY